MQNFNDISQNDLAQILSISDDEFQQYFSLANEIRIKNVGEKIHIRALLEFSNYCKKQCAYCGLNCKNKSIKRFRLMPDEIVELAYKAYEVGYKTIVLQSGEDSFFTTKILCEIVREIKKVDIAVTLSCGEFAYEDYFAFKQAGADRYLLKHETSNEILYKRLHGATFQSRYSCLENIKKAGLETGGGFMVGLPQQTVYDIAKDILILKKIGCDMAGIGPFIPHPQTSLKEESHGETNMVLRAVSLARILLPKANLPATTALGVIEKSEKTKVFDCGANVIMQKITPNNLKRLYEIYPANFDDISIEQGRKIAENQIIKMGRIPF